MDTLPRNVILVDDEPSNRLALAARLEAGGIEVRSYETAESALEAIRLAPPDALVTDLRLPGKDGLWLLEQVLDACPAVGVIVITAYGSIETAVQAIRGGAFDYLAKPFPGRELLLRLERLAAHQRERREVESLRAQVAELTALDQLIGVSEVFGRVVAQIRTVAPTEAPVLLIGETGTGKERLARAIHASSDRREGPFVALSCATLSPTLIESELFGHEEGAFSGAQRTRRGRFELAGGGTLMLDDVDDIPFALQAKLLRVLQERTIERVGGERELPVDFRLVAATKRPLDQLVAEGRFREDLMFRLAVVEIVLPRLRERPEDIGALAAHFLERQRAKTERSARRFGPGALRQMAAYAWPGNVRQLENAVEHAVTFCFGEEIGPEHLPARVRAGSGDPAPLVGLGDRDQIDFQETVASVERQLLVWAIERSGGSQVQAAKLLGLPRSTYQDRLRRYDLG